MIQLEERLAKVPLPPLSPGQTKRFTDAVFPQEGGSNYVNKIVSHRTWLARAAIWTMLISMTSALAWYATRDIWQSAREGDIEAVKQHLASGTDVNARGEDREFIKLMLANGIDVKDLGNISTETTPLYQAALKGHKELVELLLEKGANPNMRTTTKNILAIGGTTALIGATKGGYKEIVELLIRDGADVDTLGAIEFLRNAKYGSTTKGAKSAWSTHHDYTVSSPLLEAAAKGHKEIVELLIANKADINITDLTGVNPLMKAAREGHIEIVRLLVANGADINASSPQGGTTALFFALQKLYNPNNTKTANFLITKGANVNARNFRGATPLHMGLDSIEITNSLIEKGANVNAKDNDGSAPLHTSLIKLKISTGMSKYRDAIETILHKLKISTGTSKYRDTIETLAAGGYEVNVEALASTTPRHTKSLVNLLISHGANVNAKDKLGRTPLHLTSDNVDLAELLIEKGANMNARDRNDQTPLDYNSRHSNTKNIQDFLRKNGGLTVKELIDASMLREAVRNGDLQKVKQAMANSLDINATDGDNNTALDLASKNKEIADLLRKQGAKTGEELKDKAK